MVKEAFSCDKIYAANPNLVLSTDDTTLFMFNGASDGSGDWEWSIIDQTNSNQSVCSDFDVGTDVDNKGELCVRITFIFTASGLSASPYIAVSGLTLEELPVEQCPDGILSEKVKNCARAEIILQTMDLDG